jgi:hypothetical protein
MAELLLDDELEEPDPQAASRRPTEVMAATAAATVRVLRMKGLLMRRVGACTEVRKGSPRRPVNRNRERVLGRAVSFGTGTRKRFLADARRVQ